MPTAHPDPATTTCNCCIYFVEHANGAGDCHRHPPVFCPGDSVSERHRWRHPLVYRTNWCGELRRRGEIASSVADTADSP